MKEGLAVRWLFMYPIARIPKINPGVDQVNDMSEKWAKGIFRRFRKEGSGSERPLDRSVRF